MNRVGQPGRLRPGYGLLLGLARAAVLWERLWPCLWPAIAVAAVFVAVALLDLLPQLPAWLHALALIGFAGAFGFALRGVTRVDTRISTAAARHRVERDSGLDHRPLTALEDRLATGRRDRDSEVLWRAHRVRVAEALARLRVRLPSPGLARFDPYGFRAAALLMLVVGLAAGGADAVARLERALVPQFGAGPNGALALDVWINPPAYTGLAPMFLETTPPDAAPPPRVTVPVGSTLLAQAGAFSKTPQVRLGERTVDFEVLGTEDEPGGYRVETTIDDEDTEAEGLGVEVGGRSLARWPIVVVADTPPQVEFTEPPKRTGRSHLRIDYEATDDYALSGIRIIIRHAEGLPVPGGGDSVEIEVAAQGMGSPRAKGNTIQDLTAHPWAGTPVLLQMRAEDARGQIGDSDVFPMVLPERIFNHPVARALVQARKMLNNPTEPVVAGVISALDDLASRPKHFYDDTVIYLAMAFARGRLAYDDSPAGIVAVQKLLWETALRIEDGDFAIAERDLREIQERLAAAMRDGASSEELERLMDELQAALDKFLAALAERLERDGMTELPMNPAARVMESGDLQRMIEQARELARTGAVEAARRMLADLNRMLDNLREGARMARPNRQMNQARKLMQGLRELTRRQQQLLDQTFRDMQQRGLQQPPQGEQPGAMQQPGQQGQQQQGRQGQPRPDDQQLQGQGRANSQEGLRRDLGKLMLQMDEMLGSIPQPLGQAERSMRGASRSLRKGDLGGAVPQQTDAVDKLRQAMEGLSEQLARRMGPAMGLMPGRPGQRPGPGRDPFGRRQGGAFGASIDDGDVRVPTRMEMLRAREILDELRRRSGEHQRPRPELEYIDRLLRRF